MYFLLTNSSPIIRVYLKSSLPQPSFIHRLPLERKVWPPVLYKPLRKAAPAPSASGNNTSAVAFAQRKALKGAVAWARRDWKPNLKNGLVAMTMLALLLFRFRPSSTKLPYKAGVSSLQPGPVPHSYRYHHQFHRRLTRRTLLSSHTRVFSAKMSSATSFYNFEPVDSKHQHHNSYQHQHQHQCQTCPLFLLLRPMRHLPYLPTNHACMTCRERRAVPSRLAERQSSPCCQHRVKMRLHSTIRWP